MADGKKAKALVTGASSGIGATYAERLAKRGHDLVLVARRADRLTALAEKLRAETGVSVETLVADLADPQGLGTVEAKLRNDAAIGLLVNNAGAATKGGLADTDGAVQEALIRLNVIAVVRLAMAAVPGFLARGEGAIVNVASVLAVAPEIFPGVYPATKAFVLTYSQSLQAEFGARGIYTQAVLPAATRTEIWENSGHDVANIPGVMEVGAMVDAALVGFDRREPVTIPPLHDAGLWTAFETARTSLVPHFRNSEPAPRYRA